MRLILLATIAFIVGMTAPVFSAFGHGFSWRDLILIAGGLFLVWKATKEIHHTVDPTDHKDEMVGHAINVTLGGAIFQILLLDLVFSVELDHHRGRHDRPSGDHVHRGHRRDHGDAGRRTPLADFIERNPTIVMLALGFLLMIGMTLIADGYRLPRAQGLHLRRHGVLRARRGAEHAGPHGARPGDEAPPADAYPSKQ